MGFPRPTPAVELELTRIPSRHFLNLTVSQESHEVKLGPRPFTSRINSRDSEFSSGGNFGDGMLFVMTRVYVDVSILDGEDLEHSEVEARRLRLAKSSLGKVLLIAYTIRRKNEEETTRIISARRASRKESKRYAIEAD